jgi:hypothetical protein
MSFAEDEGGTRIWGAVYPTCELVRFDPATGTAEQVARLDDGEKYPQSLAVDREGWVYAGIGTARCNLVAYSPESGEVRQLLPDPERTHGTGSVAPAVDGTVLGIANSKAYRLLGGRAVQYKPGEAVPERKPTGFVYYGRVLGRFPDGRILKTYDLPGRTMTVSNPETGKTAEIPLDYVGGGAQITSLATGPDGAVYASTCHPMHLARLDLATGAITDLGGVPQIGGGNFCAMTAANDRLYGTEYAGGRLWAYDPEQPWAPKPAAPEIVGIQPRDLVAAGTVDRGHFTYLDDRGLALLRGDEFGARGHFPLHIEKAGVFYVCVQPFQYPGYARVRFLIDGKPVGSVVDPGGGPEGPGQTLSFGPYTWEPGEHELAMDIVETEGRNTWASVVSVAVSPEPLESLIREHAANPLELAQWKQDICRPRTILAHPDGRHVLMAGFAGYGLCGGGIGIYDTQTESGSLLTAEKDLLDGHSCITLKALPSGDLVGGTSVNAPGGGHPTATEAELFLLDWKTRDIVFHTVPVKDVREIISIEVAPDGKVFGLAQDSTLFVFDLASRTVVHTQSLKEYGGVPRHAFQWGPDGRLFAILRSGILEIDRASYTCTLLGNPPEPATAGGAAAHGFLCYAGVAHIWTFRIPEAAEK